MITIKGGHERVRFGDLSPMATFMLSESSNLFMKISDELVEMNNKPTFNAISITHADCTHLLRHFVFTDYRTVIPVQCNRMDIEVELLDPVDKHCKNYKSQYVRSYQP